jgi:hypothetical protein
MQQYTNELQLCTTVQINNRLVAESELNLNLLNANLGFLQKKD